MGNNFDLAADLKYIDGITIIDSEGIIRYSIKFNPNFYPEKPSGDEIIGKKLDEVFTNVNESNSTLYKSMRTKKIVTRKKQSILNLYGESIDTTNISIPIMAGNKEIGAIELSRDITNSKIKENHILKIDSDLFKSQVNHENRLGSDKARYTLSDIISNSPKINELKYQIESCSDTKAPCFIYGETGTGKELFAHSIHNSSYRKDKPFITQNCAAIPENLLESILFGTVKGSYSGALDAPGLFELANGGTLFLDEINSMPIGLQAKMLRILEDGYIRRVGGKTEQKFDVRIICASNENPDDAIRLGNLRQDIYYRLCVLYFEIPPLRNRKNDIRLLMDFFINKYNFEFNKNVQNVSKDVYEFFKKYDWPGNVRELEHIIQFSMAKIPFEKTTLEKSQIESKIKNSNFKQISGKEKEILRPLKSAIEDVEKKLITLAIEKTGGNVSKAADILDIPRQTLARKKIHYNIFL